MTMPPSLALRLDVRRDVPPSPEGAYVVYWMFAARRTRHNFALQRAIAWARRLGKPLVVVESLRPDYPWASDRFHRFMLQGMRDQAARFATTPIRYVPLVEPRPGAYRGWQADLARQACVWVTDDSPAFIIPDWLALGMQDTACRFEAVDSCGILPVRAAETVFSTAHAFRRHLHRHLIEHLAHLGVPDPLADVTDLPPWPSGGMDFFLARWPEASPALLDLEPSAFAALGVPVLPGRGLVEGGERAGLARVDHFLAHKLGRYAEDRNEPALDAGSGLSPYFHFGQVAPHELVRRILETSAWSPASVDPRAGGKRDGWWGLPAPAESFLDELVTWREVGFNAARWLPGYDRYETLPAWSRETLDLHRADPRPHLYDLEAFREARTHDPLWNAAQRQLVREGRIHNYLRMLWGKKILEWSATPEEALATMIELNNGYALDGRDPASISGIFWCLGRYDRPWGPVRPVFGTVRYMTSDSTAKKFNVKPYLVQYATF